MSSPFLSIIIPTYNSGSAINKSMESICNQSFTDYEVIIVDGVSSDETVHVAQSYLEKHAEIKIFSEPDQGVYDAMNKGIKISKGEWLYFLGSDDKLFESNVLDKISAELKTTDAEVVYGNVFSTRFSGIYAGELKKEDLIRKNICHQSIFFKRSVFKKTGLFDLKYKAHADWDHNFKWFLSDSIKHKYVELTIADYADGGFSSRTGDPIFAGVLKWKYFFMLRKELPFKKRINIAIDELKKSVVEKRSSDFFFILFQSPKFIFGQ